MILTIMTIQIVFQQEIVIGFIYSGNCYLRINTFWLREQESHEDLKENSKIDSWIKHWSLIIIIKWRTPHMAKSHGKASKVNKHNELFHSSLYEV